MDRNQDKHRLSIADMITLLRIAGTILLLFFPALSPAFFILYALTGLTDVLDGCAKHMGMQMMLRSMTPEILAVDEIGSRTDKEAIDAVMNCGCCLLATAHGASMEKMQMRPALRQMAEEKIFERYVILSRKNTVGKVEAILNADMDFLYQNHRGDLCHDRMRRSRTGYGRLLEEALCTAGTDAAVT